MRGLRAVVGLLLVMVIAGCGAPRVGFGARDDPDEYARALDSREVTQRLVAALVAGLVDAVGGVVRSSSGRYEGCRFAGDESTAFEYAVTVVLASTRAEPGLGTVTQVLQGEGWATSGPETDQVGPRVGAARGGVSLSVRQGDSASMLVLRSGAGCFAVPPSNRDDLGDLDAEWLEVPEVG